MTNLLRLLLLLLLAPIASRSQTVAPPIPARQKNAISTDDLLLIKVFRENDLESTVRVAAEGIVNLPLIGQVKIAGHTPTEAAGVIRSALLDGYLKNPQVTVTVIENFARRFTVLGQVQKPGAYDMPGRDQLRLLQAIGMAGGFTAIADDRSVILKRRVGSAEKVFKINAREMAKGGGASNFEVQPGDVISVGESWF